MVGWEAGRKEGGRLDGRKVGGWEEGRRAGRNGIHIIIGSCNFNNHYYCFRSEGNGSDTSIMAGKLRA